MANKAYLEIINKPSQTVAEKLDELADEAMESAQQINDVEE